MASANVPLPFSSAEVHINNGESPLLPLPYLPQAQDVCATDHASFSFAKRILHSTLHLHLFKIFQLITFAFPIITELLDRRILAPFFTFQAIPKDLIVSVLCYGAFGTML
jgi:hypothetical protein